MRPVTPLAIILTALAVTPLVTAGTGGERGHAAAAAPATVVHTHDVAAPAAAHARRAPRGDRTFRREVQVLGRAHALDHLEARRVLTRQRRRLQKRSPAERRGTAARARAAAVDAGPPDQAGAWTGPTGLPDYVMNAVLLHTGEVLMWGWQPRDEATGKRPNVGEAYLWNGRTGAESVIERIDPPTVTMPDGSIVPIPLYCSGQSLLVDGRVLAAGGNLEFEGVDSGFAGLNTVVTFDPVSRQWQREPDMTRGRWYPTQARLTDGRTAIMAGWDESGNEVVNTSVELFTPGAAHGTLGTVQTLKNTAGTSDLFQDFFLYPHAVVMPDGDLLAVASWGELWELDGETLQHNKMGASRNEIRESRGGDPAIASDWGRVRGYANGILMPSGPGGDNGRFWHIGGFEYTGAVDGDLASASIDELDGGAYPLSRWNLLGAAASPKIARANANTVILPTGELVTVGGGAGSKVGDMYWEGTPADERLKQVELYDPETGTWRLGAAQQNYRAYHSVAILLPDGRVWSAGDDKHSDLYRAGEAGRTRGNAEIYSPPYLFVNGDQPAPRTEIDTAPSAVGYGDDFGIETASDDVARAVLVAPGATTHGVDMNQRHVELAIEGTVAGKGVNVRAPATAGLAPPGWYMLYVLNAHGTPSHAEWVHVRAGAPNAPVLAPDAVDPGTDPTPDPPATGGPAVPVAPLAPAEPTATPAAPRPVLLTRARMRRAAFSLRGRLRGALLFSLDRAARVSIEIRRTRRGRSALRVGVLRRAARAGANTVTIPARIGRRRLRPGRYEARLTAVAPDGGRLSRAVVVRFRVR